MLSLASFLLRCRVFHFSVCLHWIYSHVCYKHIWLLCWTISRICMSFCVYGSHTVDAYSTIGLTSELYAFCFVVVDPKFRFLRRNPSVLLALPHMLLMWLVQRRSDVMRRPRYFALFTDFRVWPCSLYSNLMGLAFLLMVSTLHLSGWNSIFSPIFRIWWGPIVDLLRRPLMLLPGRL